MNFTWEAKKSYALHHARKGRFTVYVTGQDDEWLYGVILKGTTQAILDYNKKSVGDTISLRKQFIIESSPAEGVNDNEARR